MKFLAVDSETSSQRLDKYVSRALTLSRAVAVSLIAQEKVLLNGRKKDRSYRVKEGDHITVDVGERCELFLHAYKEKTSIPIRYEDDDLIAVNKPSGMSVHPAGVPRGDTLIEALYSLEKKLFSYDEKRPGVVHRLDKETSGVMVLAKTKRAYVNLIEQFKKRKIKKFYVALVEGILKQADQTIDYPLKRDMHKINKMKVDREGVKEARTRVRVIARLNEKNQTLVLLMPLTGRTHQLRVHLAYEHHPVFGDAKYKSKQNFSRLFLHSFKLIFKHPATKEMREFTVPLPDDLKAYLGAAGIRSPDELIVQACNELIEEEAVQDSISRA